MLVNLRSKGSLQVLLTSKAMLPSHVANLYISTPHPCRSVCDCSGVTSAAVVDVMNIFASLQKRPTVGPSSVLIRLSD